MTTTTLTFRNDELDFLSNALNQKNLEIDKKCKTVYKALDDKLITAAEFNFLLKSYEKEWDQYYNLRKKLKNAQKRINTKLTIAA